MEAIQITETDLKFLNKNFIIRYYANSSDTHNNRLIGLPKLREIINNDELFYKHLDKAINSTSDKYEFRLRRNQKAEDGAGIRVTFVSR